VRRDQKNWVIAASFLIVSAFMVAATVRVTGNTPATPAWLAPPPPSRLKEAMKELEEHHRAILGSSRGFNGGARLAIAHEAAAVEGLADDLYALAPDGLSSDRVVEWDRFIMDLKVASLRVSEAAFDAGRFRVRDAHSVMTAACAGCHRTFRPE
jgi:hypothetical protein